APVESSEVTEAPEAATAVETPEVEVPTTEEVAEPTPEVESAPVEADVAPVDETPVESSEVTDIPEATTVETPEVEVPTTEEVAEPAPEVESAPVEAHVASVDEATVESSEGTEAHQAATAVEAPEVEVAATEDVAETASQVEFATVEADAAPVEDTSIQSSEVTEIPEAASTLDSGVLVDDPNFLESESLHTSKAEVSIEEVSAAPEKPELAKAQDAAITETDLTPDSGFVSAEDVDDEVSIHSAVLDDEMDVDQVSLANSDGASFATAEQGEPIARSPSLHDDAPLPLPKPVTSSIHVGNAESGPSTAAPSVTQSPLAEESEAGTTAGKGRKRRGSVWKRMKSWLLY
ncbi:hypothetical protein IWQ60_001993, partial [Tieghemiomyces parasiticus]